MSGLKITDFRQGRDPATAIAAASAASSTQLGGDLSGTPPAATVVAINGISITGVPSGAGDEIIATSPTAAHWATPAGSGMSNPMTAVGDLIVGGTVTGGTAAPARLAVGTATTVLHGGTTPAYAAVLPADLDVSADNTTANATSGHHGLLPKLSGSATDALRGDGSWGTASSHVYAPLTASDGAGGWVLVFTPSGDCIMV